MGNAAEKLEQAALEVEVIEGRDAFVQLEKEWNAALAKGPRDEPMLRHEWLRAWIENFAPGAVLRTFVARTGKEIHAAIPLVESTDRSADTCYLPLVTWSLPVNDHSQRGGILLGRNDSEGLKAIWEKLQETPGWDRLRLRDLPYGSTEWQLRDWAMAAGCMTQVWESLQSPYLPLPEKPKAEKGKKLQSRYEIVEAALDAKFRQNLRRRRRRLAEKGALTYELATKDNLDGALADFYDLEAGGWKGEGGTAIALKPELVGYYTQLAREALKRGTLALGLLKLDKKPIAGHLSMIHDGRHYLIKIGYDESLHEHSPGQQLVADAIKDSCERGLSEFDFLGPDMPWKRDWESKVRGHAWLTIFRPNRKTKLVYGVRHTLWPIARAFLQRGKS